VQSKSAVCLAFTLDEHWLDASYSDHYSLSLSLLPRHPCVPLLSSVSCTYLEYIGLDASYSDHYSLSLSLLPCHPCVQPKSSVPCAHSLYLDTSAGRYRNNAVCRALPYCGKPFACFVTQLRFDNQHRGRYAYVYFACLLAISCLLCRLTWIARLLCRLLSTLADVLPGC
jgi:hypothetical protein